MHRHNAASRGIVGHFKAAAARSRNIRPVSRDQQVAAAVVPSAASDKIDKRLIEFVQQTVRRILRNSVKAHLVHRLEYQLIPVVLEFLCYLGPEVSVPFKGVFLVVLCALDYPRAELGVPAAVVVYIQDNVHILTKSVIDYLMHPA